MNKTKLCWIGVIVAIVGAVAFFVSVDNDATFLTSVSMLVYFGGMIMVSLPTRKESPARFWTPVTTTAILFLFTTFETCNNGTSGSIEFLALVVAAGLAVASVVYLVLKRQLNMNEIPFFAAVAALLICIFSNPDTFIAELCLAPKLRGADVQSVIIAPFVFLIGVVVLLPFSRFAKGGSNKTVLFIVAIVSLAAIVALDVLNVMDLSPKRFNPCRRSTVLTVIYTVGMTYCGATFIIDLFSAEKRRLLDRPRLITAGVIAAGVVCYDCIRLINIEQNYILEHVVTMVPALTAAIYYVLLIAKPKSRRGLTWMLVIAALMAVAECALLKPFKSPFKKNLERLEERENREVVVGDELLNAADSALVAAATEGKAQAALILMTDSTQNKILVHRAFLIDTTGGYEPVTYYEKIETMANTSIRAGAIARPYMLANLYSNRNSDVLDSLASVGVSPLMDDEAYNMVLDRIYPKGNRNLLFYRDLNGGKSFYTHCDGEESDFFFELYKTGQSINISPLEMLMFQEEYMRSGWHTEIDFYHRRAYRLDEERRFGPEAADYVLRMMNENVNRGRLQSLREAPCKVYAWQTSVDDTFGRYNDIMTASFGRYCCVIILFGAEDDACHSDRVLLQVIGAAVDE